ncbi:hypothetical protein D3C79_713090 [compost metagenome]
MLYQHHPEQGHEEHLHCPLDQASEGQHVPQHDPRCNLRIVQPFHITCHGQLRRYMLVAYHRLHKVFGGRLLWAAGRVNLRLAQAQPGSKHREKPVRLNRFGKHIGQRDQCQGQVIIGRYGTVVVAQPQEQRKFAQPAPHPVAKKQTSSYCP